MNKGCKVNGKLTMVVDFKKPERIATLGDTLIDKIDRDRLESEYHISSSSVVGCSRLLPPERIYIFVQLYMDLSTRAPIIMVSEISTANPIGQSR